MEHKAVIKNRFAAILIAILCSVAIFCCALWANYRAYAAEGDTPTHTYELTGVTVTQKNTDPKDMWVFTNNTPDDMLNKMVYVTVSYNNVKVTPTVSEEYTLVLTGQTEGNAYLTETGEKVVFSQTKGASSTDVKVTVTPKADAAFATDITGEAVGTFNYDSSNRAQNGLYAVFKKGSAPAVTSATKISDNLLSAINVYVAYNDGTRDANPDTTMGAYTLSGNFFPEDFENPYNDGDTYNKAITVSTSNGNYSTSVLWENVSFVSPTQVGGYGSITGTLPPQFARSTELDISGLSVQLVYKGIPPYEVPLSTFKNYLTITYFSYDEENNKYVKEEELTTAIKRIVIKFNYPGKDESSVPDDDKKWQAVGSYDVTINPLPIHVPLLPNITKPLSWNEGASIEIGKWDYADLYEKDPPKPVVTAVNHVTGANETLKTSLKDGIMTVSFPRAAVTYDVSIELPLSGDFQWDNAPDYVSKPSVYKLGITVQVEKGTPVVALAGIGEVTYGTPNSDGTLSATIEDVDMKKTWTCESSANSESHKNDDNAWFYHIEYYTAYTDKNTNTPLAEGNKRTDGKPKNAGTYYAVAVTHENSGYLSATSPAFEFVVDKFTVQTQVNSKTFTGDEWTINDFFSANNTFPYDGTALTILTIKNSSGEAVDENNKFCHADEYTVNISLKDSDNYKLSGDKTAADVTFGITTNESSQFDFTVSGWTYGSSAAGPNINISYKTGNPKYLPSNTGVVATDFVVKYYNYAEDADDHKGAEVTIPQKSGVDDFSQLTVGRYIAELTANKDSSRPDDTVAAASGTKVDYTLPSVCKDFIVTASPIVAPYLGTQWNLTGNTAENVYTYDDTATGKPYSLTSWIGGANNIAADGSKILTVTVTYTQLVTTGDPISVDFDYSGNSFTVNKAGNYTVEIELNKNYSWDTTDDKWYPGKPETPSETPVATVYTYSYVGYVARQQLAVLGNTDVTGTENTYNGSPQTKTIGKWNDKALKITGVTVAGLETGHTPIAGGITPPTNAAAPYSNEFSVTHAGLYTVTVAIADKDNYEWMPTEGATGDETNALRPLTLYYTLKRAPLQVKWYESETATEGKPGTLDKVTGSPATYPYHRYVFDGTLAEQKTPTAKAAVDYEADNAKLTINTCTLYSDKFNTSVASITAKGYYYIAVTGFGGAASADYCLPNDTNTAVGTIFEIFARTFAAPTGTDGNAISGTTITEIYNGKVFDLTKFIGNYASYSVKNESKISVTTTKEVKAADTYTVTIAINDTNYSWEDESVSQYTFTLTVEQRTVTIEWTDSTLTTVYGETITPPTWKITNIAPDDTHADDVKLELGYKQGGKDVALKDAGVYTVYAKSTLLGNDAANYKIVTGTSNESATFTVQKKSVAKPTLPTGEDNEFNGTSGSRTITFADNYDKAGVSITASGVVPNGWFTTVPSSEVTIGGVTIDFASGSDATFTYTRAGVYSFTVSLDAKNYFWEGEGKATDFTYEGAQYTYTVNGDNAYTVNLKALPAPNIKSQRAQECDKTTAINFGTSVEGVSYTVRYGVAGADPSSNEWLGFNADKTEGVQNVYYAELTLSVTDFLNYKWKSDSNDVNDGSGYLQGHKDEYFYTESGVIARVYYAITRGQLELELFVKNYTYGDNGILNGVAGGVSFDKTAPLDGVTTKTVYLTGDSVSTVAPGGSYSAQILLDGTNSVVFTDQAGNELSTDDLVNGMPWNSGTYTVRFTLKFGDGDIYENKQVSATFQVYARDITVAWENLSLEYNADNQMASAKITNVIKKNDADTTDYKAGLTLTVGLTDGGTEHKNATTYNVKVTAINGAENVKKNFKLPTTDLTNTFAITPKAVTVKGTEVSAHVYGNIIEDSEKGFNAGVFYADGAADAVVVKICAFDKTTEIGRDADVGTYYVVPAWSATAGVHATNYNVTFDDSATFTVVKRTMTVEWKSADAHSVYGNAVDLYDYINVTATNGAGGVDSAFAGKAENDVISLKAYNSESAESNLGVKTGIGTYTVTPAMSDVTNWGIEFTNGDAWAFVIDPATIKELDNSLTPKTGMEYIAEKQNVFIAPEVEITNPDSNTATWKYGSVESLENTADDVTDWKDMTDDNNIEVYTAGDYFFVIKITADNHNEFTKTVKVHVEKATLSVRFDFAIMYGEDDPASKEYLFGDVRTAAVDGKGWTVTGFKGSDEALFRNSEDGFYHLNGESKYAVVGYEKGDFSTVVRKNYNIEYAQGDNKLFTLDCDNYKFNLITGKLTVNKIEITVTGKNISVKYNGEVPTINTENVGYTVKHPTSSYDDTVYTTVNYGSSIKVTSNAFTKHNANSTTADCGSYPLVVTATESPYYTVQVNNGTVTVTPADLVVEEITGYNNSYDEHYHGLSVNGQPTVNEANGDPNTVVFATASDNTAIVVEFYEPDREYASDITESDLVQMTKLAGVPSYIDRGVYRIVYKISAGKNYKALYGYREIEIIRGTNSILKDFGFANKKETKSSLLAEAQVAWTYGYKADKGFNPDGDQHITDPEAQYKRANATQRNVPLKYQLRYFKSATDTNNVWMESGDYANVTALFNALFGSSSDKRFDAGYYRLTVFMSVVESTDNFTFTPVNYVFQVAKRDLTVTAENTSTDYGEAAPAFKPVYTGLVSNKPAASHDTIDVALGNTPNFVTEYTVGDHVGGGSGTDENDGKYRIYVDNQVASAKNYNVSYPDAWLTVNKRTVTINIDDKETTYNKQNSEIQELTFTVITNGTDKKYGIYAGEIDVEGATVYNNSNQHLLVLHTEAIVGDNTNNVKTDETTGKVVGYTIYATFVLDEEKGYDTENDYIVKFYDCALKEADKTDAIGFDGSDNNAGSYVINKASFSVYTDGVHHKVGNVDVKTEYYSGAVNEYVAKLKDGPGNTPNTKIDFKYQKKNEKGLFVDIDADQVIDAGDYQAIGTSSNPNYTAGEMTFGFTIQKTTLTLTANDNIYVEYGTTLSGNVENDKTSGIVKEDGTGRFTGFTYTPSSPKVTVNNTEVDILLEKTVTDYLTAHTVGYTVAGYNAKTPVEGASCTITPTCDNSDNISILAVGKPLTVKQRAVSVTIVGWDKANESDAAKHNPNAWCYYQGRNDNLQTKLGKLLEENYASFISTDTTETFGDSGASYADLGIKLSLPSDASNVGIYEIDSVSVSDNFDVTITNKEAGKPKLSVQKAKLTLYANALEQEVVKSYSRTYGESIVLTILKDTDIASDGFLRYTVKGMVDGESFYDLLDNQKANVVFTVKCGTKDYAPWDSVVSEEYTVAITEFRNNIFTNYIVDTYVPAKLSVTQRSISASTVNQVFDFDGTNYNNGLYGKEHNAVITFADAANNAQVNGAYRPVGYNLSYTTMEKKNGNVVYQTAGGAPTVVGDYTVTVALDASGNYIFDNGTYNLSKPFSVTAKPISTADLNWFETLISTKDKEEGTVLTNTIKKYQTGYLTVAGFEYAPTVGTATDILAGDENTPGTYYFDEAGTLNISMSLTSIGRYTVRIELRPEAIGNHNIELKFGSDVVTFVSVSFDVTAETVTMEIEFADFVYGGNASEPTVYINGTATTNNLTIRYALINDTDDSRVARLYANSKTYKGVTAADVVGLQHESLNNAPNFVAGYYVLYIQYRGTVSQHRYYVFKVDKKPIDLPTVALTGYTYNGERQSVSVAYSATDMRPAFNAPGGSTNVETGSVTFEVLGAGNYDIKFVLVDSANTVWNTADAEAKGATVAADTATYVWAVARDTSENDPDDPIITIPELSNIVYGQYFDNETVITKPGYSGRISLFYKLKSTGENKPTADSGVISDPVAAGWTQYSTTSGRLNANNYWIMAVVTDTTGSDGYNYSPKATVGEFDIAKKGITATISGSIVYGDKLADTHFTPVVDGILSGDRYTLGDYTYAYAESYEAVNAGGNYEIVLDAENDVVKGIDAGDNYIVKPLRGKLTVNKRTVNVSIDGMSGDYAVNPDLSKVVYNATTLASGEDKEILGIVFTTNATNRSVAGGEYYIEIGSWSNNNYDVQSQRARYVVNPLEVGVSIKAQTNITFGDKDIYCAELDTDNLTIANAAADAEFVKTDLRSTLKLVFSGTNYSGVTITDSADAPTRAGRYTARVVGASANYKLTGMPEVSFEIQKKVLDESKLYIASQVYTGELLTPVVTVEGNAFTDEVYDIGTFDGEINAGRYDVMIRLKNAGDYKWSGTENDYVDVLFVIDKADDEETTPLSIKGWQYGRYAAADNSPYAEVKSGSKIVYEYSVDGGRTYSLVAPENGKVGKYYVRARVEESDNYAPYIGSAVQFEITKYLLNVPTIASDDNTYTGKTLTAVVSDYDMRYMTIGDATNADTSVKGTLITVTTVNAGNYKIYIELADAYNYGWQDGKGDAQGVLTLDWTIAKKKIKLPTTGKNSFVVNGGDIVYVPDGFDANIMSIEKNKYSYGGDFTAVITLKDYANYEWEKGGATVELKWHITGSGTVFAIILTVLLVLALVGAGGIVAQLLVDNRRKHAEAKTMNSIEKKDVAENGNADTAGNAENAENAENADDADNAEGENTENTDDADNAESDENADKAESEPDAEDGAEESAEPESETDESSDADVSENAEEEGEKE